jgi:MFS transporter, YNFM family, putative membrane transport protein
MFAGVTAAQLGISDVARLDRGAATALYFSIYYSLGALGAYVPGVAWQEWGWHGVVVTGVIALTVAVAGLAAAVARGPVTAVAAGG